MINPQMPKSSQFSSVAHSGYKGTLFEVVLLIIAITLVYIYLLGPKNTQYKERRDQLAKLESQSAELERQEAILDKLTSQISSKPDSVTKLDQALPLDSQVPKLYVLLENYVATAGMATGAINVQLNQARPLSGDSALAKSKFGVARKLTEIPITIGTTGTMSQLSTLLGSLENSARILDVTALNISQGKGEQFIFQIGLSAFSYSAEADTTTGAVPAGQPIINRSPQ